MQQFSIADIESLTGIKAHTLRIWEQRYSLFTPQRKESRHRIYDNDDLKELLRIATLYHAGWKVSRIAALSTEERLAEVASLEVGKENVAPYISRLIESAVDFDERSFIALLDEIIDRLGFEACIIQVCYPFLTRIGHLWSTNHVIPAQEHFSTYIIRNKVITETEKLRVSDDAAARILLFCPQGEFHELPLLYLHHQLKKHGWKVIYLGINIKLPELKQVVAQADVDWLYLHLITNLTGQDLDEYLAMVCKAFLDKRVAASGQGIQNVQRSFTNFLLLRKDEEIYRFIHSKGTI